MTNWYTGIDVKEIQTIIGERIWDERCRKYVDEYTDDELNATVFDTLHHDGDGYWVELYDGEKLFGGQNDYGEWYEVKEDYNEGGYTTVLADVDYFAKWTAEKIAEITVEE